jgi:hypothetical protein
MKGLTLIRTLRPFPAWSCVLGTHEVDGELLAVPLVMLSCALSLSAVTRHVAVGQVWRATLLGLVGASACNIATRLEVHGVHMDGYRILKVESSPVPYGLAAVLQHLRDPTGLRAAVRRCSGWPYTRMSASGRSDVGPSATSGHRFRRKRHRRFVLRSWWRRRSTASTSSPRCRR